MNIPPFDDLRVRQAVNMAINKDRIVRILNNRAVPANQPLPPNMPGYDPDFEGYSYDPAGARALLAAAGHPDGFELEILALSQPPFAEIATAFQQAAAPAGVRIKVTQGAGNVVYGQMRKRTFDMIVGRALGGKYGDPHSNVSNSIYNPDNSENSALQNYAWRCSFQDAQLNKMIEEATR